MNLGESDKEAEEHRPGTSSASTAVKNKGEHVLEEVEKDTIGERNKVTEEQTPGNDSESPAVENNGKKKKRKQR